MMCLRWILLSIVVWRSNEGQLCFPNSGLDEVDINTCVLHSRTFPTKAVPHYIAFPVKNETDCCLWRNVRGYAQTPTWMWSSALEKYHTNCKKCDRDKFVKCYQNHFSGCTAPQDKLALSPTGCCSRRGIAAYSYMNSSVCHLCQESTPHVTNFNDGGNGWSNWSQFSACSSSCGLGYTRRFRKCQSREETGRHCEGENVDTQECEMPPCPLQVDHALTHHHDHLDVPTVWGPWSQCHVTCGVGVRARSKICPAVDDVVLGCAGHTDLALCELDPCPSTSTPHSGNSDSGITAAWAVAGVALIVTLVGLGIFYCCSRYREPVLKYLHNRRLQTRSSTVRVPRLPAVPPPPRRPKYRPPPVGSSQDADGYEVPLRFAETSFIRAEEGRDRQADSLLVGEDRIYEQIEYVLPDLVGSDRYSGGPPAPSRPAVSN